MEKSKQTKTGVATALKKVMEKYKTDWNPVGERIMTVDMIIKGLEIKIFGIYAPTYHWGTKNMLFGKPAEELSNTKNSHVADLNRRVDQALESKIIRQYEGA